MKFYLPNFEDLVDPEYDFINDAYSPNRENRWEHDWFAHQFYDEPIFDGMLISKASITPMAESYIQKAGSVHRYTRLDPNLPIMGDCGAFTFFLEEHPTYTVREIIDYYHHFGFTYGVSLDHLAFVTVEQLEKEFQKGKLKERWWEGKTTDQIRRERFDLTLQNAQEFLNLWAKQKPIFHPVGIAQGPTPELYEEAVARLVAMGYDYIALGGLVRSKNKQIIEILARIQPHVKNGIRVHIFGVARLSMIPYYKQYGVISADSSASLRQAFLGDGENNYHALDGQKYAAIRVPLTKSKHRKRGLDQVKDILERNRDLSTDSLADLEQKTLNLLRAYDRGESTLDETLETVLAYDRLHGVKRDYEKAYRRTLTDKPWQHCDCPICKNVGVEVIIFRGNNRNRRRGFHNVKVFHEHFREVVETAPLPDKTDVQPQLF